MNEPAAIVMLAAVLRTLVVDLELEQDGQLYFATHDQRLPEEFWALVDHYGRELEELARERAAAIQEAERLLEEARR